jgi:hypothetical protein
MLGPTPPWRHGKCTLKKRKEGKKYSYIQVFVLKKTEDIPHIGVKNRVKIVFSKVYYEKDHRSINIDTGHDFGQNRVCATASQGFTPSTMI